MPAKSAKKPARAPGHRPLPERISPSRAKDFAQCPKLFFYKTILGMTTPNTIATTRGTLAHAALELIFDHPRPERTAEVAVAYVRPAWAAMVDPLVERASVEPASPEARVRDLAKAWRDELEAGSEEEAKALASAADYRALCAPGSAEETELLTTAEECVVAYFSMEDPKIFDPVGRELHLQASALGVTMHGFIDRLDKYTTKAGEERVVISDYKTGRVPSERFTDEAFFAMKVYAVLYFESFGVVPHQLRLIYVREGHSSAIKKLQVTPVLIERTKKQMAALWKAMKAAERSGVWETKTGPLCPYCHFQDVCPAFNSGIDGLLSEEQGVEPLAS